MTIHLGQVLFLFILLIFWFYSRQIRNILAYRFMIIVFVIIGSLLILFPNISSIFANWIGIGRGVDFIFYLFILFGLFYVIHLETQLRFTQKQITQITRQHAIDHASFPDDRNLHQNTEK